VRGSGAKNGLRSKLKILVVGAGSPNADMVAEVLRSASVETEWTAKVKYPSLRRIIQVDVVYGIYLQTCSRYILLAKLLGRKTILHFVGSDAYRFAREKGWHKQIYWRTVLWASDLIFYVSPHLRELVRRPGIVLPFPIAMESFKAAALRGVTPDRDILYFCPGGEKNERLYRLDWILEYARAHPDEKITIIGNQTYPANYPPNLPNVSVIPYVPQSEMPDLYVRHKKLVRMTTEDGLPRMMHEALLCGLKVIYNGEEITQIPPERDPSKFAEKVIEGIQTLDGQGFRDFS